LRGRLLVTEVQQDGKITSAQQNSFNERLIKGLQHAPTRQWMEEYLDLVSDLLTFTELSDSDPRLVLSPTKGFGIAVTVNRRHVLTSCRDKKSWTGFIFKYDCTQLPEMLNVAARSGQFDPHPGEVSGQTPYVLRFEGSPKDVLTLEQKTEWKEAILIELKRGKSSPYKKKWHDPDVYKIATDLEYRALVLDKVFPDFLTNQPEGSSSSLTARKASDLSIERERVEAEGYFNIENLEDARRRTTVSIVHRQGQPEFRRKLLNAYNSRCPITGCDAEPAIEAAHIIPYQGTETNHLTNGLPLRADVHTLFDLHLLSIQPATYKIVVAPELSKTCYQELAGQKLTLPEHKVAAPNQDALKKHYDCFLQRCGKEWLPDR
jgi:HNH endonuclease